MDHKNGSLYYLKICMSVINFVILAFFSIVTSYTIYYINQNFSARDFLENVTYLPMESVKMDHRSKRKRKKKYGIIFDCLWNGNSALSCNYPVSVYQL